MIQAQRFCKICQRPTLHQRPSVSTMWGCFLTVITAGLFLLFWVPAEIFNAFKSWRCQTCGQGRML